MPKYFPLLGLLLLFLSLPATAQAQTPSRRLPAHAHPKRKARLDAAVPETSALCFTDGALWTLNDSGNPPGIFRLDSTSGRVVQRVRIRNFPNVDWEELAADAKYFYIGDFGNNAGNRRDLRVLRVAKAALGPADTCSVAAEAIAFTYPDQTEFSPLPYRHNFDCERWLLLTIRCISSPKTGLMDAPGTIRCLPSRGNTWPARAKRSMRRDWSRPLR